MKGTFKGSVYFDRITRAQLEELAFVLTLGENTPASPRLHKIGHGKPVGYGSCKITLTGGCGVYTRNFFIVCLVPSGEHLVSSREQKS